MSAFQQMLANPLAHVRRLHTAQLIVLVVALAAQSAVVRILPNFFRPCARF